MSAFTRVFDALWGDEAIQSPDRGPGLLRFARNDGWHRFHFNSSSASSNRTSIAMQRTKPPFRADHVGSFLRSAALKEARAKRERNEIPADALQAIEDREIEAIIKKQESVGLKSITDGEYRRAFWNYDFLGKLDGVEAYLGERKIKFQGKQPKPMMLRVIGQLGTFSGHPMLDHFRFVRSHTRETPKMTIPSPSSLHFRYGRSAVPEAIYPDMGDFYRDLGQTYRKAARAFADAGCRYLQLDEVNFTYLCDPKLRQQVSERGDDPERLPHIYADMINTAISDLPADAMTAMHLCRGNFQSTFVASGGYEPVAEILFNTIRIKTYFMEYDSDRAGGFEPLRFVPKDKIVVLGLVTSKSGKLEPKDELKRRIEQATKYIGLDQLCLSPQCGFASTEEGNLLAEDEQWAKLRMIVELADEVWGR
jgi:5-methyltetrahydropteroyltriglutamate--homocysteine methyltransferase